MKNVIKFVSLCLMVSAATGAQAAVVSAGDQLIIGGVLDIGGAATLDAATEITLSGVDGTAGTGGINDVFGLVGTGGVKAELPPAFAPVSSFFSIDGWDFDLLTLSIVNQNENLLQLEGTGLLSDVSDSYNATWTLSAQSPTSYDLTVTVVPVPAAVWLFGSGLIGLVGIARRKV